MREQRIMLLNSGRVHEIDMVGSRSGSVVDKGQKGTGASELTIVLPHDAVRGWTIDISGEQTIKILEASKNCDGAMVFESDDGTWHAVVVELAWGYKVKKARQQLAAGIVRLTMILDFLGIVPQRWTAVFAYGTDLDPARRHRELTSSTNSRRDNRGPIRDEIVGVTAEFTEVRGSLAGSGTQQMSATISIE